MKLRISAALLALAACSNDHSADQPDAAPTPDAPTGFVEATPSSTPVTMNGGGTVLTAPVVQPIFFANDATMQAQTEDFLTQLAASSYWSAIATEYGVGALTINPTIVSTDTPPTSDTALATWVGNHFDGMNGWPAAPDPQTIYAVFLPAGVTISTAFGQSCQAFGGYHDEAMDPSSNSVVYAIMPRCQGGIDGLSSVTSHEIIEAATDPHVETTPAYVVLDNAHYIWGYTPGGEVGDMCEYLETANQQLVGNYYVQRIWSNAAMAAGHDPCVPALAQPYLGAMPVFGDALQLPSIFDGSTVTTQGVQVTNGSSKTIEVDLYSDQQTGDFTVKADDVGATLGGSQPELSFTWDKQTGHNGDKLHLTINRLRDGQGGGSELVIVTKDATMTSVGLWWGFVGN